MDPTKMLAFLTGDDARGFLQRLWEQVGELEGESEPAPAGAFECRSYPFRGGATIVVIKAPPPQVMTEVHFIGIVFAPKRRRFLFLERVSGVRYLTLELTMDDDDKETNVLCEWSATEGGWGHANYGAGLENPTVHEFAKAVRELLTSDTDPEAFSGFPD
jgi:hypothetical protein